MFCSDFDKSEATVLSLKPDVRSNAVA